MTQNEKTSCPIYFLCKNFKFCLKMTADFFVFWSLWPKNGMNQTICYLIQNELECPFWRKVLRCLDFRSWFLQNIIDSSDMKRTFFWHPNLGSIGGGFIPEDARSHISHLSSKSRVPSLADLTGKNQGPYPGLGAGLGFSRPGKFTFNTNISWVLSTMAIRVVELSSGGYKIGKIFA